MPLYENDFKYNDDVGAEICHAVRSVLTALGVYNAPWIITIEQINPRTIRIESYWNPRNTFPKDTQVNLEPSWFTQECDHDIKSICDLNICALARAIANRMKRRITPKNG